MEGGRHNLQAREREGREGEREREGDKRAVGISGVCASKHTDTRAAPTPRFVYKQPTLTQ